MDAISVDAPMCPVPRHREAGRDIICLRIMTRATRSIRENIREPSRVFRPRALLRLFSRPIITVTANYSIFRAKEYFERIFKGTTMVSLRCRGYLYPKTFPFRHLILVSVWKVGKFLIINLIVVEIRILSIVANVINGKGMRQIAMPDCHRLELSYTSNAI